MGVISDGPASWMRAMLLTAALPFLSDRPEKHVSANPVHSGDASDPLRRTSTTPRSTAITYPESRTSTENYLTWSLVMLKASVSSTALRQTYFASGASLLPP